MPSAPANPHVEPARRAPRIVVRLGPEDGTAPSAEDETDALRPLEIVRRVGGRALDHARFALDLGALESRLEDLQTPEGWNRQVEVVLIPDDSDGPLDETLLFWGELSVQKVGIDPRHESAQITARIEPYHFGRIITGYEVRDPVELVGTHATVEIQDDLRFNPLIDGKVEPNRSGHQHPDCEYYLWVDPESVRTPEAALYQSDPQRGAWSLADAVFTLCGLVNPDETYLRNPTRSDLTAQITDHEPPELFNVRIRRGLRLPEALDELLEPHGFGWYVALAVEPDDPDAEEPAAVTRRTIRIFRRGAGEEREIYLQRPGEELDPAKTNVPELSVETSVADLANEVAGYGSLEQRELTIELFRGWTSEEDTLSLDDLDRGPDAVDSQFEEHPNAWRLWIANEAGDYTGLRDTIDEVLDLQPYFTSAVPRRRVIDDCLTKDANGRRRPPLIEWRDPDDTSESSLGTWKPIRPGSVNLLRDQIGVYFGGEKPPDYIHATGASAALRITGTLTGDTRLTARAAKRNSSPAGRTVTLQLDLSDRFHDRKVESEGEHKSRLADDSHGAFTADDRDALQTFVEKVRDVEDSARIAASCALFGLAFDYELSEQVTKVAGREISLNRNSSAAEEKRYLQITGITLDVQQQRTELHVEVLSDQSVFADHSLGSLSLREATRTREGRR